MNNQKDKNIVGQAILIESPPPGSSGDSTGRKIVSPLDIHEKWNENVEECSGCRIKWKKIGKQCPVCYAPAEANRG